MSLTQTLPLDIERAVLGIQGFARLTVLITTVQLQAMVDSIAVLVPAPGLGKLLLPQYVLAEHVPGRMPFGGEQDLNIRHGLDERFHDSSVGLPLHRGAMLTSNDIAGNILNGGAARGDLENQPIIAHLDGSLQPLGIPSGITLDGRGNLWGPGVTGMVRNVGGSIIAVDQAARTFTTDVFFVPGQTHLYVGGSTANNGVYTITGRALVTHGTQTVLIVAEAIPSPIADGTATAGSALFTVTSVTNGYPIVGASLTTRAVTGVNQGTQTFQVDGDHTDEFPDGSSFNLTGSTGNDGGYNVTAATFATGKTSIVVDEAIPSAVVGGVILRHRVTIAGDHSGDFASADGVQIYRSTANDAENGAAAVIVEGGVTELVLVDPLTDTTADGYLGNTNTNVGALDAVALTVPGDGYQDGNTYDLDDLSAFAVAAGQEDDGSASITGITPTSDSQVRLTLTYEVYEAQGPA